MLLRTLASLSRGSATLCKELLELRICHKLREILMTEETLAPGASRTATVARPHDQIYQLLSLSNELLPPLPKLTAEGAASAVPAGAAASSTAIRRSSSIWTTRTRPTTTWCTRWPASS